MKLRIPFLSQQTPPPPTPSEKAEQIIRHYAEAAGLVGIPGALTPHLDTLALGPMWAMMTFKLASCHGLPLSMKSGLKIVRAVIASALTFYAGIKTAGWMFSLTGVGLVPVMAMNVTLNAALTYAAGHAMSKVFSSADNDSDSNNGPMVAAIIEELKKTLPKTPSGGLKLA